MVPLTVQHRYSGVGHSEWQETPRSLRLAPPACVTIPAHGCPTAKVWTDRPWPLPLLGCWKLQDSWNSLLACKSLSVQIRCFVQKDPFLALIMNGRRSAWISATSLYYKKIYGNHRMETFNLLANTFDTNIWYLTCEIRSSNNLCSNLTVLCYSKPVEFPDFALTIRNPSILDFLPPAFFCLSGFIKECKLVAIFHICSLYIILKKQRICKQSESNSCIDHLHISSSVGHRRKRWICLQNFDNIQLNLNHNLILFVYLKHGFDHHDYRK